MSVKYLFSTLAILLATLTFFALDTIADSESADDGHIWLLATCLGIVGILILIGGVCVAILSTRKERTFLKAHSSKLSSEDPKVLLELAEKCDTYLKDRYSLEVTHLSQQAKTKRAKIRFQANLEPFKAEISEDGSHPRVVATLKEQMHNPDSFQHVSSDYETVEPEGKSYHKIVMTFRGRNTFNALVLQTCYFLLMKIIKFLWLDPLMIPNPALLIRKQSQRPRMPRQLQLKVSQHLRICYYFSPARNRNAWGW